MQLVLGHRVAVYQVQQISLQRINRPAVIFCALLESGDSLALSYANSRYENLYIPERKSSRAWQGG